MNNEQQFAEDIKTEKCLVFGIEAANGAKSRKERRGGER